LRVIQLLDILIFWNRWNPSSKYKLRVFFF